MQGSLLSLIETPVDAKLTILGPPKFSFSRQYVKHKLKLAMEFDLCGEVGVMMVFMGVEGSYWLGGVCFGVSFGVYSECSIYVRCFCFVVSELLVSFRLV